MRDSVFLPERFRPTVSRRRPRRRMLLVLVLPLVLTVLPQWRLQTVEIDGCPELPAEVRTSLFELEGSSVFTLDLDWVRRQLEMWPCVAGVDVHFELPGTLMVNMDSAVSGGSIVVGHRWHSLSLDGRLAGPRSAPRFPVLMGFPRLTKDLREGLAVAQRLERQTGATVQWVRRITPSDLEARLIAADSEQSVFTVHVTPEGSGAEQLWCQWMAAGNVSSDWADLRWHDRMVISGRVSGEAT